MNFLVFFVIGELAFILFDDCSIGYCLELRLINIEGKLLLLYISHEHPLHLVHLLLIVYHHLLSILVARELS